MEKILRILGVMMVLCTVSPVHSAEMVNVEFIHQVIAQKWDIMVPYNPSLGNLGVAANMKYLLCAIDRANAMLNGTATNYGDGQYATLAAADTDATITAVNTLIHEPLPESQFWVTTIPNATSFSFSMSAMGTFAVDWGDGTVDKITRTNVNKETYSHTYAVAGEYTIGFGGHATKYNSWNAAISFPRTCGGAAISGSLGAIFPTIGDGSEPGAQPCFSSTFMNMSTLGGPIPPELFDGVHGAPIDSMFSSTFARTKLSGSIPPGLFSGISGPPTESIFYETFASCGNLTGEIPADLFSGIVGKPAPYMFTATFTRTGVTGEIPSGLFAGISGPPAEMMFYQTFYLANKLTSIGDGVFGDLSGPGAENMFGGTFNAWSFTGPSARTATGKYLYEIWPDATTTQVGKCYYDRSMLTDRDNIPSAWK